MCVGCSSIRRSRNDIYKNCAKGDLKESFLWSGKIVLNSWNEINEGLICNYREWFQFLASLKSDFDTHPFKELLNWNGQAYFFARHELKLVRSSDTIFVSRKWWTRLLVGDWRMRQWCQFWKNWGIYLFKWYYKCHFFSVLISFSNLQRFFNQSTASFTSHSYFSFFQNSVTIQAMYFYFE